MPSSNSPFHSWHRLPSCFWNQTPLHQLCFFLRLTLHIQSVTFHLPPTFLLLLPTFRHWTAFSTRGILTFSRLKLILHTTARLISIQNTEHKPVQHKLLWSTITIHCSWHTPVLSAVPQGSKVHPWFHALAPSYSSDTSWQGLDQILLSLHVLPHPGSRIHP